MNKNTKLLLILALVVAIAGGAWGLSGTDLQGLLKPKANKLFFPPKTPPSVTFSLSGQGGTAAHTIGTQDATFMCFQAKAVASNATINSITFQTLFNDDQVEYSTNGVSDGTHLSDIVTSVRLVDSGGNVVAPATVIDENGILTFNNFNYALTTKSAKSFCLRGDISQRAYTHDDPETFAFYIETANSVSGTFTSGNALGVNNMPGFPVNLDLANYKRGNMVPISHNVVTNIGSLNISVAESSPKDLIKEDIVVAGTTGVPISKYQFRAVSDAFTIRKLSINNSQSAATTAALGDYDNNVNRITISYLNSDGVEETKTGFLSQGTAIFEGLDFYVGKNTTGNLTVSADINTMEAGAQAGEFVSLNLAFNNFEAISEISGETFRADKIDATVPSYNDLDFGNITWTDGRHRINADVAQVAELGSNQTLIVDDGAAGRPERLPVGTLLCVSFDVTCNGESIMVVTDWRDGVSGDTVTTKLLDNADNSFRNDDDLVYALPGSGYLWQTNPVHIYESKPTVYLSANSPSGSRDVSANDNAFAFSVAADPHGKVQFRTAKELTTCSVGFDVGNNGDQTVSAAEVATTIDGSACRLTQVASSTAGDSVSFDAGANNVINQYARASFWLRADASPEFSDIEYGTDASIGNGLDGRVDNLADLAPNDCTFRGDTYSANMVADTWYFCDVAVNRYTTTERYFHIGMDDVTELANTKRLYIDHLVLYNDKLEINIASPDLDTQANGAHGLVAYLKDGGSTVATGYVAKNSQASAEGGAAKVVFYPIEGINSALEIAAGTSKALTLQLNTSTLLAEDAGADDPLTFSINLGTSVQGAVTAGGLWWNDTNFSNATAGAWAGAFYDMQTPGIIKWVGAVANPTLTGNVVNY